MADLREAVDAECLLDRSEIEIEKLHESAVIAAHEIVDRAIAGADLLTCQGKRILLGDQQKRQVIVPQVVVEPVIRRHRQQMLDLRENAGDQLISGASSLIEILENAAELHENAVFRHIAVDKQFGNTFIHD